MRPLRHEESPEDPRGFLVFYSSPSIIRGGNKLPRHADVVREIEDRAVWGLTSWRRSVGRQSAVRDDSRGLAAVFVREATEGGFEESLHFAGGAGDGGLHIR